MQWPYIESLRTVGWPESEIPKALEAALRERDAELRRYREIDYCPRCSALVHEAGLPVPGDDDAND